MMCEDYETRFQEVINLLIEQNCCMDNPKDEIVFAERIIGYLKQRITGLKKNRALNKQGEC